MALKGNRHIEATDITRTCTTVAERGVVAVQDATGSGVALGGSAGSVKVAANASGLAVVGLLLNDVVTLDETRYHRNFHKDTTQLNERVTLLRRGWVITDRIIGTPTFGATAYLDSSGFLTPTAHATGGVVAKPKVGMFGGTKDENGFVRVDINLPVL